MDPAEAAAAWHGPVSGGAAHLHPGATLVPQQTLRLLLPCRPALPVSSTQGGPDLGTWPVFVKISLCVPERLPNDTEITGLNTDQAPAAVIFTAASGGQGRKS